MTSVASSVATSVATEVESTVATEELTTVETSPAIEVDVEVTAQIEIIVAMDEGRLIGQGGGLPWRLPADLARFKALTMGHALIVGRKTYDSIGRPLPGRLMIVVSRTWSAAPPGVLLVTTLDDAIRIALRAGKIAFIGGGAAIFAEALQRASRIHLTLVHARLEGDAYFPDFDRSLWKECARELHPADSRHEHAFSFIDLARRESSSSTVAPPET